MSVNKTIGVCRLTEVSFAGNSPKSTVTVVTVGKMCVWHLSIWPAPVCVASQTVKREPTVAVKGQMPCM